MVRISFAHRNIGFVLILAIGMGILDLALAQENTPAIVTVTGTVDAVSGTTVVVSGVSVDVSAANVTNTYIQVGVVVQITGSFANGIIAATTIVIINPTITVTPAV